MQHPFGIVIVLNKHSLSLIIHLYITQHDSIEFSVQTFDRWRSFLTRDAHTHLVYSTIVLFLLSHSSHLQLIILRDAIVIPVR